MSAIEIQSKARELKELKVMKEELEAAITAIEDALKAAMGDREENVLRRIQADLPDRQHVPL